MSEIKITPGPWDFTRFNKSDGSPIETVQDVANTTAFSAFLSDKAELWGVTTRGEQSKVICYTGNGPTSMENARALSAFPDLLDHVATLTAQRDALLAALRDIKTLTSIRTSDSSFLNGQLGRIDGKATAASALCD